MYTFFIIKFWFKVINKLKNIDIKKLKLFIGKIILKIEGYRVNSSKRTQTTRLKKKLFSNYQPTLLVSHSLIY